MSSPQQRALQGNVQQRTAQQDFVMGAPQVAQQSQPPAQRQLATDYDPFMGTQNAVPPPSPQTGGAIGPRYVAEPPSSPAGQSLGQTIGSDLGIFGRDVQQAGGRVVGGIEAGVAGYESITQPIRNVTQGPGYQGTPEKVDTVAFFKQGGLDEGLGPVERQIAVTPAQGPTQQQTFRESAFLAAGIIPGGDLIVVGEKAGAGILADIGSRFALGASFGASTSALKGGSPEQIAESAAFGGAFLGVAPIAGKAGAAIGSKFGDLADTFRTPSTISEPTGSYSGTVGGQPGIVSRVQGFFDRPPSTPGQQLTDIPGGEAPIPTRQFGEVFAQQKFGIEPTPSTSYEFEYGTNKPFQYSAAESRQSDFPASKGPAGPGYQGGGGGGQVFEQESGLRTPPGSAFNETAFFRGVSTQADVGEQGFASRFFATPGFASQSSSASSSAVKTILLPISDYSTTPGISSLVKPAFGQGQSPSTSSIQSQIQPPAFGLGQSQGVGIGQGQGQGVGQTQPTPTPSVTTTSPGTTQEFGVPNIPKGIGSGGGFGFGFAQPFPDKRDKGFKASRFGFRQLKHPGIENYLDIGGRKSRRKKR